MSRIDAFSSLSRRNSFNGVGHPAKTVPEVVRAAWKRSAAGDHAKIQLTLQFFSHMHALLGINSLDDDKPLEKIAVRQLQPTAPALCSVFTLLFDGVVQPLQIKASGRERPRLIPLDCKGNAFIRHARATKVELCQEEHCSLLYKAYAPRPRSVDSFLAKKRKPSLSMTTIGRQSRKVMRGGENEADVGAGQGPSAKIKDAIDATPLGSGASRSEAKLFCQVLKRAIAGCVAVPEKLVYWSKMNETK